jgi:GT2 family glycosyltransferase
VIEKSSARYANVEVAVIVLGYKNVERTSSCVTNILKNNDVKIYVVENESDGMDHFAGIPEVTTILNRQNLGFSTGMNIGIRRALFDGYNIFVLLNNDCIVTPGAIEALVIATFRDETTGLVSANRAFSSSYSKRVNGSNFDSMDLPGDLTAMNFKKSKFRNKEIGIVTGFCMCTRRDVLNKVGLLDEDFFFGKEDDEFSVRITNAGYRLLEVGTSIVLHHVNSSIYDSYAKSVDFLAYHMGRGRALLERKTHQNQFIQVTLTFLETCRIFMKTFVIFHKMSFSIFKSSISGFRNGNRCEIHTPPAIAVHEVGPNRNA